MCGRLWLWRWRESSLDILSLSPSSLPLSLSSPPPSFVNSSSPFFRLFFHLTCIAKQQKKPFLINQHLVNIPYFSSHCFLSHLSPPPPPPPSFSPLSLSCQRIFLFQPNLEGVFLSPCWIDWLFSSSRSLSRCGKPLMEVWKYESTPLSIDFHVGERVEGGSEIVNTEV